MKRKSRAWMTGARKYDSEWEKTLAEGILSRCSFHEDELKYSIPKTYKPDFVYKKGNKHIYIEAKGRFFDSAEARKYIFIKQVLEEIGHRFVFLFWDPNKAMPHAKKRSDGTRQTHGEWADKNGFEWYTEDTISKIFNKEPL